MTTRAQTQRRKSIDTTARTPAPKKRTAIIATPPVKAVPQRTVNTLRRRIKEAAWLYIKQTPSFNPDHGIRPDYMFKALNSKKENVRKTVQDGVAELYQAGIFPADNSAEKEKFMKLLEKPNYEAKFDRLITNPLLELSGFEKEPTESNESGAVAGTDGSLTGKSSDASRVPPGTTVKNLDAPVQTPAPSGRPESDISYTTVRSESSDEEDIKVSAGTSTSTSTSTSTRRALAMPSTVVTPTGGGAPSASTVAGTGTPLGVSAVASGSATAASASPSGVAGTGTPLGVSAGASGGAPAASASPSGVDVPTVVTIPGTVVGGGSVFAPATSVTSASTMPDPVGSGSTLGPIPPPPTIAGPPTSATSATSVMTTDPTVTSASTSTPSSTTVTTPATSAAGTGPAVAGVSTQTDPIVLGKRTRVSLTDENERVLSQVYFNPDYNNLTVEDVIKLAKEADPGDNNYTYENVARWMLTAKRSKLDPQTMSSHLSSLISKFKFPFRVIHHAAVEKFLLTVDFGAFMKFVRDHHPDQIRTSAVLSLSATQLVRHSKSLIEYWGDKIAITTLMYPSENLKRQDLSDEYQEILMCVLGYVLSAAVTPGLSTRGGAHSYAEVNSMQINDIENARRMAGSQHVTTNIGRGVGHNAAPVNIRLGEDYSADPVYGVGTRVVQL